MKKNFKNFLRRPFSFKGYSLGLIWFWLSIFSLVPIILTLATSLLSPDISKIVCLKFTLTNYGALFNRDYFRVFIQSLYLASSCTLVCLILGYPFAFIIARSRAKYRPLLLLLMIIPFWISSLIRTYAIMAILKAHGLLNMLLLGLGIIHQPLQILYGYSAVLIGSVYDLLPFMILPLYANLEKLDDSYIEAARDLGANKITTFIKVIIPLSLPGIIAGSILVFLPAMTLFFIPVLLGGAKNMLLGNLIENQFLTANNWPVGSALSIVISLVMGIFILVYRRFSKPDDREGIT